ncbi:hypothetical protein [Moraxella cuniculi]|nr:hypothetical protein [Moraxella cuniculi]
MIESIGVVYRFGLVVRCKSCGGADLSHGDLALVDKNIRQTAR